MLPITFSMHWTYKYGLASKITKKIKIFFGERGEPWKILIMGARRGLNFSVFLQIVVAKEKLLSDQCTVFLREKHLPVIIRF